MNEHTMREIIETEKKDCKSRFISWRTVVIGGFILVGSVFGWSLHVEGTQAKQTEQIKGNTKQITEMKATFNGKLDKILVAVEKK